jgi:hypothetical protein
MNTAKAIVLLVLSALSGCATLGTNAAHEYASVETFIGTYQGSFDSGFLGGAVKRQGWKREAAPCVVYAPHSWTRNLETRGECGPRLPGVRRRASDDEIFLPYLNQVPTPSETAV